MNRILNNSFGRRKSKILIFSLVIIAFVCGYLQAYSSDIQGALLTFITLLLLSSIIFRNKPEAKLLWFALILKFLSAFVYLWVFIVYYKGRSDSLVYSKNAIQIMESLKKLEKPDIEFNIGVYFVYYLTGFLYLIIGANLYSGSLVYSWLSFIGMYLFYKAFKIAFPNSDQRLYIYLIFFFPSILFWTSQIGKDALMFFFLGLVAYSTASLFSSIRLRELFYLVFGMTGTLLTRPEIAMVMTVAVILSFALSNTGSRISRMFITGILFIVGYIIIIQSMSFMKVSEISYESVTGKIQNESNRTYMGRSKFENSPVISVKNLPMNILNSFIRPFLWEVRSFLAFIASLESILMIALFVRYFKNIASAIRNFRTNRYLIFIISYSFLVIISLSTIGNLGLLVRQRVQLLPFFFMFIAYSSTLNKQVRENITWIKELKRK